MTEWHYEKNGERHGAVSAAQMSALVEQGVINRNTLVWSPSLTDWQPLGQTDLVEHLKPASTPPALPGHKIGNAAVWILAFAPLIGYMLEAMVAGARASSEYTIDYEVMRALRTNQYWYITLLLNIGLSLWDEKRLKRAGVDTSTFGKTAFIVPVYLWKRLKALNQSPAPFWVWVASFVLTLLA